MSYYYNKVVDGTMDAVVEKVVAALKKEGFGVLINIDMAATLKEKLNVDFRKYRILGACNPPFALKALEAEDKIGTMLPCNVIIQEITDGSIEVAVINPVESMQAVQNPALEHIATEVQSRLHRVVDSI